MIPQETWKRWFDYEAMWDHPATVGIAICVLTMLTISGCLLFLLQRSGGDALRDAWHRWKSWTWLSLMIMVPILLGGFWTVIGVMLLSLGCYREFARATGLMREKIISLTVTVGILVLTFATLDHYDRLFFATGVLTVGLISIVTIPFDRPEGFIQRTALGVSGFLLFGFSLSYLGYFTNDVDYRPRLLLVFLAVAANDIYAYCFGRLMGRKKILPRTSPGKTIAGSVGALIATTLTVVTAGHFVFQGTAVDHWALLAFLGMLISILGQVGDLLISSMKRDLGLKDIGQVIPGHGGLLDRFDSMILVPPTVFHFLSLCLGPPGEDQPQRIFTMLWKIGN